MQSMSLMWFPSLETARGYYSYYSDRAEAKEVLETGMTYKLKS